jgi:hypothetical protein
VPTTALATGAQPGPISVRSLPHQHEARGADQAITRAIDTHVQAEQATDEDGQAGALAPVG